MNSNLVLKDELGSAISLLAGGFKHFTNQATFARRISGGTLGQSFENQDGDVGGNFFGDLAQDDLLDHPVLAAKPVNHAADHFFLGHTIPGANFFQAIFTAVGQLNINILTLVGHAYFIRTLSEITRCCVGPASMLDILYHQSKMPVNNDHFINDLACECKRFAGQMWIKVKKSCSGIKVYESELNFI